MIAHRANLKRVDQKAAQQAQDFNFQPPSLLLLIDSADALDADGRKLCACDSKFEGSFRCLARSSLLEASVPSLPKYRRRQLGEAKLGTLG